MYRGEDIFFDLLKKNVTSQTRKMVFNKIEK